MGSPNAPRWQRAIASPAAPLALFAVLATLIATTITRFSTWIDESASLLLVEPNGYRDIVVRTTVDAHPPLWYLALKPWLTLFGPHILASRAQAAVFMLAGIAVWYRFLRTRFSRSLALVTLALAVTNPMLLHYAVEGRMYALAVLLVAVSCTLITGQWRWRWYAYWPCAVAMLYTHYFLSFMVLGQFVYLWSRRRDLGMTTAWLAIYGATMIAALAPWLPYAFAQTHTVATSYFWIGPVSPATVLGYVLHTFLHRFDTDLQGAKALLALVYLAAWGGCLVRAGRARGGPFVLLWCVQAVPWLCLFVLSAEVVPVFHPRYVIFGLPALITLLAAGALAMTPRWRALVITVMIAGNLAGIEMLRDRGFADIRGYWTMKKIAKEVSPPVDGEVPTVVATWIFGFFDAKATLDRSQRVVMLSPAEPRLVSPDVVYYEHPDWYVASLSEIHARHVWVIDDLGRPPIDVPPGWKTVITHRRGYARTRLFVTDATPAASTSPPPDARTAVQSP